MTSPNIPPICMSCSHYRWKTGVTCDAYPDGIPYAIIWSRADHRKPYFFDRGIRFEQDPTKPEPERRP